MFGRDHFTLFFSGSDESASGQVISPSEQPSRALVDGQDGLIGKELISDP